MRVLDANEFALFSAEVLSVFGVWFAKMPSDARTLRISNIPGQEKLCFGTFRWECNNVTLHESGSDGIFADHSRCGLSDEPRRKTTQ